MNVIIKANNLTKTYGEKETSVTALDNVNVDFNEREFTAIMGPSGSGKSTLLHCLAGLDRPSSGQIFLKDSDISTLNDKQLTKIRRDSFGFVFQAFNLIPTLTAEENITLPASIAGRKPDMDWVKQVVKTVDIDDSRYVNYSWFSNGGLYDYADAYIRCWIDRSFSHCIFNFSAGRNYVCKYDDP